MILNLLNINVNINVSKTAQKVVSRMFNFNTSLRTKITIPAPC